VQAPSSDSNRDTTSTDDGAGKQPDEGADTSSGGANDDTTAKSNDFPQGATNPPVEVPEPGTLGLLLAGLLSCAAARRKR